MMDETRNIGSRLELLVDDWLIDRMSGVRLRMHHPVAREIALEFNRPWEGETSWCPVVIKEGDTYRLWYRACREATQSQRRTAYAESGDGIHWERPDLGIFDFQGSRQNNIVMEDASGHNLSVFVDENPNTPEAERYKGFAKSPLKVDGRSTIRGFTSPDGLNWLPVDTDPLMVAPDDPWPIFDSPNIAFWDGVHRRYVAYLRGWVQGRDGVVSGHSGGVRTIRRSVSDDFRNWSVPEMIDMGDSPLEHLYTNAATPYYRAPHIYLMFPKRLVLGRKFHADFEHDGLSEAVFMTSRDGIHWDRRFMEALIRPGPDPDNWNERNMAVGTGVVPTGPAEISLYYVEHWRHPTARLRRATLRTDGFVSVSAPYGGGEFVTRPLTFAGSELAINYATSVAGGIRTEVQDAEGRPLDGYELSECVEVFGDEIERPVAWRSGSDVAALAGIPVRLRFVMKEADLYSLRFQERS